jgi:hypothetical protein
MVSNLPEGVPVAAVGIVDGFVLGMSVRQRPFSKDGRESGPKFGLPLSRQFL